jgi:hypothetical protein
VGYSIAIVVVGALYLAGRREAGPRLLLGFGIGSLVVFGLQYSHVIGDMSDARATLAARGLAVTVSSGFGVWVELFGALLTLAGGFYAVRLSKNTVSHQTARPTPAPGANTGW